MPCPDLFRTHRKTLERCEPSLLPRGFPVNGGGEETGICERRLHLEPIGCNEQNPLRLAQEKGVSFRSVAFIESWILPSAMFVVVLYKYDPHANSSSLPAP